MRNIAPSASAQLSEDQVKVFFAVDLLYDTNPVYTWTGLGSINYNGNTYLGAGNLLNISSLKETADIEAAGARITITGIPSSNISQALTEPYQGRKCIIYTGFSVDFGGGVITDYTGAQITTRDLVEITLDSSTSYYFVEVFSGYMDTMNIQKSAETLTIDIGIQSRLVDLERERVRRYTSEYQKSVYPGDLAFDFINDLQDKEVIWGRR